MNITIEDIKHYAEQCLSKANGSHAWEHTQRVYNLCIHIGRVEGADQQVLELAAYLHDIGRSFQDKSKGAICHAEKGSEMAHNLLEQYPISEEQRANVLHCIRTHRFRGNAHPQTLEAKILFDADKLDAIGAIGIARAFQFAGEIGAKFHNSSANPENTEPYSEDDTGYREFMVKLRKIKHRMLTAEGLRMAEERHAFMEAFFERFLKEHEGIQ